jgi:hypothetical protein
VPLTKLWTTSTKQDRHTDTIHAVGKAQSRSNCLSFDIVVGATIERGRQDTCIGGILLTRCVRYQLEPSKPSPRPPIGIGIERVNRIVVLPRRSRQKR